MYSPSDPCTRPFFCSYLIVFFNRFVFSLCYLQRTLSRCTGSNRHCHFFPPFLLCSSYQLVISFLVQISIVVLPLSSTRYSPRCNVHYNFCLCPLCLPNVRSRTRISLLLISIIVTFPVHISTITVLHNIKHELSLTLSR